MPPEQTDANVSASTVVGSQAATIDTTIGEVNAAEAAADAPSADKLNVTQAQFDKYYNAADDTYNWEAHAREQAFVADQAGDDTPAPEYAEEPQEVTEEYIDDAQDIVDSAGLDWDDLTYKIGMQGDIDPVDYDALMALGIPREVIQNHISTISNDAQEHVSNVTDAFGGKEQWMQTQAWANRNLNETELDQLNVMLASPNYQMAVDMIQQRAGTSNPTSQLTQTQPGTAQVAGYASQAEMVADQRKPEYKRDPEFRARVMARAARSDWAQGGHTL